MAGGSRQRWDLYLGIGGGNGMDQVQSWAEFKCSLMEGAGTVFFPVTS